jgi:hypothetical protein
MAIAVTQLGLDAVQGNKKETTWSAVLSGTSLTAGEVVTAATLRVGTIDEVRLPPATAGGLYAIQPVINAARTQLNLVFTELTAGAAGTPALQVKTNAEAYVTDTAFEFTVRGNYA